MKVRLNFIVIPLVVFATAIVGGMFTNPSSDWYLLLEKPSWIPPGVVFGIVWTTIYVLAAVSAFIEWNTPATTPGNHRRRLWIAAVFLLNAFLNAFWSYLFFGKHMIGLAIFEAFLLAVTVVILMILLWRRSRIASLLLLPYAAWTAFATYLNAAIWFLNG